VHFTLNDGTETLTTLTPGYGRLVNIML